MKTIIIKVSRDISYSNYTMLLEFTDTEWSNINKLLSFIETFAKEFTISRFTIEEERESRFNETFFIDDKNHLYFKYYIKE